MHKRLAAILALLLTVPAASVAGGGDALSGRDSTVPRMDRSVEPVVLTGAQFPTWSAGPDPTAREPQVPTDPLHQSQCFAPGSNPYDPGDNGDHSCYQDSRLPRNPLEGAPVARLLGFKWNPHAHHGEGMFAEIPFQVDERFTRYLSNNVSGFAFYSNVDQHNTYAFDREGFRYTSDAAQAEGGDACQARPAPGSTIVNGYATTPDPVKGLDNDDELVFMERDAGPKAPSGASLPAGVASAYQVAVVDPLDPTNPSYVYVMLAGENGPSTTIEPDDWYVRYQRDANADLFVFSESSFEDYGAAPKGPYCTPDGTPDATHGAIAQRRPIDTAWIQTPRYSFRYEGRWLMTELHVSNDARGDWAYGPDLIDRWKARAFAQDPGSETPCCGFEEEDTNWGGSSILMGERWGPVRAIRETWGADSSTNNARREVFYRDLFAWGDALRVHPIPPLDGIYSQWDFNAGRVSTYYNPVRPEGVPIDGSNDEAYGNFDDPCNERYDGNDTSDVD